MFLGIEIIIEYGARKTLKLDTLDNRRAYICKECGKEGFVAAIKDHIESNHLGGIRLPCTYCGKIFRFFILTKSQQNDILIDEDVKSKSTFNFYYS